MKLSNRILSVLLALVLAVSCCAPALALEDKQPPEATQPTQALEEEQPPEEEQPLEDEQLPEAAQPSLETVVPVGEIQATLRLDYAQRLTALQNHNVKAGLYRDGTLLGEASLGDAATQRVGAYPASVRLKNADGGEDTSGWPRYVTLTIGGLPQGNYVLQFTGLGYRTYAHSIPLQSYSQHLILGTGDSTFTLGDVNGDGYVNEADRDKLSQYLGSGDQSLYPTYDLDGDGSIGLADLVYVNQNLGVQGEAEVKDTALIQPPVDMQVLSKGVTLSKGSEGALADLFTDNGTSVSLSFPDDSLSLPIDLSASPVEMTQMVIRTPEVDGFETGSALVEYTDGSTESLPIQAAAPAGVYLLPQEEGVRTITLELGKRVPVKKVTITVDKVGSNYVTIETIQFLKDIVPENPVAPNRLVTGLTASAGHEKATLKWRELPNVTGYRVDYWAEGKESAKKSLYVSVPYAEITSLENLKKYFFTVTPTADGWAGDTCAPVEATPQPSKRPDAPDMVQVTELEGALGVSWKQAKSATYYEVYYKEKDASQPYQRVGGSLRTTSTNISSLKNGTAYQIYVVAGNDAGKSGASRIAEGTPKAVVYDRPAGLPTSGLLGRDKIESIRLAAPGNYAQGEYSADKPFSAENMIDGDYRTHWTAASWYGNEHVITTFTQPVDLQAVLWSPRLDGNYPRFLRAYSIQVWYDGEDLSGPGHLIVPDPEKGGQDNNGSTNGGDVFTWPNIPNKSAIPTTKFAILPFGAQRKVKQISVAVEQDAYNITSCSEISFMEYDPAHCLPDEIAGLFSNELRTQLNTGVTLQKIEALRARLNSDERFYYLDTNTLKDELALAQELLSGPSTGVVAQGLQSRSAAADSQAYQQSGSQLQPLGAAAKAGQEITIYATGIPSGETVTVYASQFNAEASTWLSQMGTLSNGRNTFTVPKIGSQATDRGGSLYVSYNGANASMIQLHVRRATDIPVLELSGWQNLDDSTRKEAIRRYVDELNAYISKAGVTESNKTTNCLNVTEISTPSVLLSLPALAVKNSAPAAELANNLYNTVLAWEDIIRICNTTQGIDGALQTRQNVRCMQMFSGAFMYAAGSHIGIGYGSCAGMCTGKPISQLPSGAQANNLFGWGIAHEIGHNMDKLGRAEITNNLYALMVQTWDGDKAILPSRLEKSGKYAGIFNKVARGLPGASNDVFVQLGLYWQLHLAYDDASPTEFYNNFFKAWKAGTYFQGATTYDEKVALTAAGVAERDLTEFFTRWGFVLGDSARRQLSNYPKEERAIWYLNDQSRRDRLAGVPSNQQGSFTATAAKKAGSDNEIEITITPPSVSYIQGYEILRDNKPIAFVPHTGNTVVYTDFIGSGNHLAFTYSVKAYSTLGNEIGTAQAGQVRVAYDKTVPTNAYSVTRNGTQITFTLKSETSVSGVKFTGANIPQSGAYTITVTTADKPNASITARTGDFSSGNQAIDDKDSYLTYLNKPGTGSTDTRVWTYDAKSVTITGVPENMKNEDIQLISYAGDDVSFLTDEGGFMGRLESDYDYGDGTIPAGTLVIVGTYRGDPVFNTLQVKGKFTTTKVNVAADGTETLLVSEEVRAIDGYALMFAEIPEDQKVSDISDGLFLFVPNVQKEAELQDVTHCDGANLLPSQVMVEMYRTDNADGTGGKRVTAQTLWMDSPGGSDLPVIQLK